MAIKILLTSFLWLYFQLIYHTSYAYDSTKLDSGELNTDTMDKFGHILDAESLKTPTSSDPILQAEIGKLQEPDFLLIGVVKSGSTSLYHYMMQHPEISGVESTYLLPDSIRDRISNIIQKRNAGKLPRVSKPPPRRGDPSIDKETVITIGKGVNVKRDIYEINNFNLARMMKPIIDQKEVRFFDSFWYNHLQTVTNHSLLTAWKWYLDVFNQDPVPEGATLLRGEASPTYFATSQFTAERIKLWLPNVKLILLLRNPVRRFVSHLKMIKENHASNMGFRKQIETEEMAKRQNKTIANDQDMRRLLEYDMGGYNPFNKPYDVQQRMGYNASFLPETRYGKAKRMTNFMRTRGRYGAQYKDRKDIGHNDVGHENDEYINEEATQYEEQRQSMSAQRQYGEAPPGGKMGGNKNKEPVNKMEEIIGSIYKLSIYQIILVSNANPDSQPYYAKRWGVARDVRGYINRLLFGGIYTMRMKEWLRRFDSGHLFFRESSELFNDPIALMQELEAFLDVTPYGEENWSNITTRVYNVELEKGKGYKHKVQDAEDIEHWDIDAEKQLLIERPKGSGHWLSQDVIKLLKDYYRSPNQQLSELFDGLKYKNWDY